MKSFLLGTAALATLCLSLPALAADLPARVTKAPPVLVSPAYDWSGFYLGVHAGYTFGEDDNISTTGQAAANIANVAGGARPGFVWHERDGFIGGGQAGYNWQLTPNWVMGLETDISYVDIRRDTNVVTIPLNGIGTLNNNFRTRMEYFGTVRGRIGYALGSHPALCDGWSCLCGYREQRRVLRSRRTAAVRRQKSPHRDRLHRRRRHRARIWFKLDREGGISVLRFQG